MHGHERWVHFKEGEVDLMSLTILFVSLKFAQYTYLQQKPIHIKVLFLYKCQYIPETLMKKNIMGIIGNDMRIK